MSGFTLVDYVVFAVYVVLSVAIGVWFVKEQRTVRDYFLAGQSMNWFVVAISVIAALFSGISYLGAPTEVYNNDMTYAVSLLAFFVATPVTAVVFLPFFYRLNLYSAYEYLEKRFDIQVRLWSSAMFILRVVFYLALAIYAPALAVALEGVCPLTREATLEAAVRTASRIAVSGDTVLLSPACASLDMFRDYAQRGRIFAEAVRSLAA